MSMHQAKTVVHTYILPYFLYCPLIWMFCRKKEINLINKVHKRALKTVYNDSTSSFDELLLLDNSVCFHKRHLQMLMLEVFKVAGRVQLHQHNFVFRNVISVFSNHIHVYLIINSELF